MSMTMPVHPEDLTSAVLTELVDELRPGLTVEEVNVVDVNNYGTADNATSVSTSARVTLDVRYGGQQPPDLPTRLIAKMSIPGGDGGDPWCGHLDALFENEVSFYGRLRHELDIEAPLGLGGRFDHDVKRYVLLMEDIRPKSAHINSMMDPPDVKIIEALLDTLAKLHAKNWNSPRFKTDLAWVTNQVDGSIEELLTGLVRDHIKLELEKEAFKREMMEQLRSTEEEMCAGVVALKHHNATLPQTFLHGDMHIGNTYTLPDGTGGLYDFQVNCHNFVVHDISYLIQTGLSVDLRRKHERDLLAFYRDRLGSYGVEDPPSLETLWLEHRRYMLFGFYLGWLPCPRDNYGWEVFVLAHLRMAVACDDHDSMKLVRELM